MERFSQGWVEQQRIEWRNEPLSEKDIAEYRVCYDIPQWSRINVISGVAPFLAIERLCCEIDRLRSCIINCLNDNAHLADGENCTLIDLKRAVPQWELSDE